MRLTFVRHTTVAVPEGICYGQSDVPLADSYLEEWRLVTEKLGDLSRFGKVYSSPLTRCRLFASKYFDVVVPDNRLMELHFGDWEGLEWADIFSMDEGKRWFQDYLRLRTPNGESYVDMTERVRDFLAEIDKEDMEDILVVTHSGVIRIALTILGGYTVEESLEAEVGYGAIRTFDLS